MVSCPSSRADLTFWGASSLAIALAVNASPAQAEGITRIEISGHVAPRCWATRQTSLLVPTATMDPETVRATRCTQGTPLLAMRVLDAVTPSEQNPFPHRAAVEIVVSPQL
jgi:hypothetical protein